MLPSLPWTWSLFVIFTSWLMKKICHTYSDCLIAVHFMRRILYNSAMYCMIYRGFKHPKDIVWFTDNSMLTIYIVWSTEQFVHIVDILWFTEHFKYAIDIVWFTEHNMHTIDIVSFTGHFKRTMDNVWFMEHFKNTIDIFCSS